MGRYYEAPHYYTPEPGDDPAIFLAGGITNCVSWHPYATEMIDEGMDDRVVIINPARENFPIHDPNAGFEQVSWEQHHLHLPGMLTLFWFPASDPTLTVQPIAMFELGQALGEGRPIVVGADPGYPRHADVHMLCQLNSSTVQVHSTLLGTVRDAVGRMLISPPAAV